MVISDNTDYDFQFTACFYQNNKKKQTNSVSIMFDMYKNVAELFTEK